MKDREHLVYGMADALQSLSAEMLDSGTARWGAYELAGLINVNDRQRPDMSASTPIPRASYTHPSTGPPWIWRDPDGSRMAE
jgi:hypothetical protein